MESWIETCAECNMPMFTEGSNIPAICRVCDTIVHAVCHKSHEQKCVRREDLDLGSFHPDECPFRMGSCGLCGEVLQQCRMYSHACATVIPSSEMRSLTFNAVPFYPVHPHIHVLNFQISLIQRMLKIYIANYLYIQTLILTLHKP